MVFITKTPNLINRDRQFYVPIPIMWPSISKYAAKYIKNDLTAELMFRTFMVLVTCKRPYLN